MALGAGTEVDRLGIHMLFYDADDMEHIQDAVLSMENTAFTSRDQGPLRGTQHKGPAPRQKLFHACDMLFCDH